MLTIQYYPKRADVLATGLYKTIRYNFEDEYDLDDHSYIGTTCLINDGDGGVLRLEVDSYGVIADLRLVDCAFLGSTYLTLDDILQILADLQAHNEEIREEED